MKALLTATVSEFFKQRAGMFFVVIAVLFGFLSGREHYAFAAFFLTDRFGMLYLFLIWLAYTLFCVHFLLNLWKQQEYHFVFQTRLWNKKKRLGRFSIVALGFLQPLIFYGIYMFSVAYQAALFGSAWPIPIYYLLLTSALAIAADWRIHNPSLAVNKKQSASKWQFPRPASWIYWSIEFLFREKGVTLLICKTGAAIVFVCTLIYYGTDDYDLRLPAIGLSLAYLLNIGLSYELFRWESVVWMWNRSLPVSITQRFLRTMLIHALVILPETLICLRYVVLSFGDAVQLYSLGLGIIMLFHTYLYKKSGLLEDSMGPVLIGFVILTLVILYKIPLLLIASSCILFSYFIFRKWYLAPGGNKA
jgi:hypothetical protein